MSLVRLIQTAKDTQDRLTEKNALAPAAKAGEGAALTLRPNRLFQRVEGFGGAFTEAAAYTFYRMEPTLRQEILRRYFDPALGIGYSMGRVHINSCDFALGNYDYVERLDAEFKTFDISHEDKWTVPFIREAEAARKGGIRLLASPWSPPAWMKTNDDMNHGGTLLPQYARAWARYYAKYIKAMRTRGLDIWAITVQNEPAAVQSWDSCIYSAEEEGAFVRDHLGPVLQEEGLDDVKLYIWDHNRDIIVERACGALADPEAAKYVYGIANHWYLSEEFENLTKVHDLFPEKHILFSEGCLEGGLKHDSWKAGEKYARNMIGDFNNWQEGWLDWNIVLDEMGGPNHVGNYCDAPIIADTAEQKLYFHSSYYYIGHFSKYVLPGARRVDLEARGAKGLGQVAFQNEDGSLALIVLNETDGEIGYSAGPEGDTVTLISPAHSIQTLLWNLGKER